MGLFCGVFLFLFLVLFFFFVMDDLDGSVEEVKFGRLMDLFSVMGVISLLV